MHDRDVNIERLSGAIGCLRMMIGRRVLGRLALARVAPMLDLSDLDVLLLVPGDTEPHLCRGKRQDPFGRSDSDLGCDDGVSVGKIARAMRVDPSRASRLVAGLVEKGFLYRKAAPDDGRSSRLFRTDEGERLCAEIRAIKRETLKDIVADWSDDDLGDFAEDFEIFIKSWERRLDREQGEREKNGIADGVGPSKRPR